MPKKPSSVLTMQERQPLSTRQPYTLTVTDIKLNKAIIRFETTVVDDHRQAGRIIGHELSAVLAPNSPLARFLDDGFGITLSTGQSVDLAGLVGQHLIARFTKPDTQGKQEITTVAKFEAAVKASTVTLRRPSITQDTSG